MTDADLIALCAFEEANLEPDDGLAAVVRVIKNRMARKFQSDGTVPGTILHGNGAAFSWAAFAMEDGHYTRVANGPAEIEARAEQLLVQAQKYVHDWQRAQAISSQVMAGSYAGDSGYQNLTDDVVMYLNPAIASAPWATADKLVCRIGHHSFYRA